MASTYTWEVVSGTVPPGLTVDVGETDLDTTVTGTATIPGTYVFTVRITNDVSSDFDDQEYTIEVLSATSPESRVGIQHPNRLTRGPRWPVTL